MSEFAEDDEFEDDECEEFEEGEERFILGQGETFNPSPARVDAWRGAEAEGVRYPHELRDVERAREELADEEMGVHRRMALACLDEAAAAEARCDGAGTEHEKVTALGDRASALERARIWQALACR